MPDLRLMVYRAMMWKRHQLRTERNRNDHELRYLFFEVSRRCNIHCRYCGSDCTLDERANELTTQEWLDIIDQIAEDFDPKRVMVAVTGGEPLFRPDIFEIYKHLHEKGFHYGMVCNSTLLTPEAARHLADLYENAFPGLPAVDDLKAHILKLRNTKENKTLLNMLTNTKF